MDHAANVKRLAAARFLSIAGSDGAFFVGLWGRAVYEFRADPAEAAPLLLAFYAGRLLGSLGGGPLVDRFDPRRVMVAGELAAVPAALSLLLPSTLNALTAVVTVRALTQGVVRSAEQSFGPFLVSHESGLGKVNSSLEVARSAAMVVGAGLAGLISGLIGFHWVFLLDALTSAAAVLLVRRVAIRGVRVAPERMSLSDLSAGFRLVQRDAVLALTLAFAVLRFLVWGIFAVYEPLFFRDALRAGPDALGWINAIYGMGLVAGSLLAPRLTASGGVSVRSLLLLAGGAGLGTAAYVLVPDLRAVAVAAVAFGTCVGTLLPTERTLLQVATPSALVGRVMGVLATAEALGNLLSPALVSTLGLAGEPRIVLLSSGLILVAVAAASLPLAAKLDRARRVNLQSAIHRSHA